MTTKPATFVLTVPTVPVVSAAARSPLAECESVKAQASRAGLDPANLLDHDMVWADCRRKRCPVHARF